MTRPARPERSRSALPLRQLSRFCYLINPDMVFGTHSSPVQEKRENTIREWLPPRMRTRQCSRLKSTLGRRRGRSKEVYLERRPMSEVGQSRKYSLRANVFRCSPNNGHTATTATRPSCAKRSHAGLNQVLLLPSLSFRSALFDPVSAKRMIVARRQVAVISSLRRQGGCPLYGAQDPPA
jgi:hypothetical protein